MKTSRKGLQSSRDVKTQECLLGAPSRQFPLRPRDGLVGRYRTDGTITFDRQSQKPWDFMATGTGTTGVTVGAFRDLRIQVNHIGALDGWGSQQPLGVLHLDWGSQPLVANKGFRMTHDLRRSVIRMEIKTEKQGREGKIRVELRAHKEMDVIRLDIFDEQESMDGLAIRFQSYHPHATAIAPGQTHLSWYVNQNSIVKDSYAWSGIRKSEADKLPDPLLGRCFGMAVAVDTDTPGARWRDDYFSGSRQKVTTVWITGASDPGGHLKWKKEIMRRLKAARAIPAQIFVASHERWWADFWSRSCFEPRDTDGRFVKQRASWDFYRYYTACSSSDKNPWPTRWLNFMFAYTPFAGGMLGYIVAVEFYQILYAAVRTGDAEPLRERFLHRDRVNRVLAAHCRARFDHPGVITAAETTLWGCSITPQTERQVMHRYYWQGNIWLLLLMLDYCAVHPEDAQVEAILRRCVAGAVDFFREHYPRIDSGYRVFYPSACGETWCGVTNSAELVSALLATLPRLVTMGRERKWNVPLVEACRSLLAEVPPIPRGRFILKPKDRKALPGEEFLNPGEAKYFQPGRPVVMPGNDLVPASEMDRCEGKTGVFGIHLPDTVTYRHNFQDCELFPIWPGKLCYDDPLLRAAALRAYRNRYYKNNDNGWDLDVVLAANLGLVDEVRKWYDEHFDHTHVFACGLAQEWSTKQRDTKWKIGGSGEMNGGIIPVYPSNQALGTSVIPVIDQLVRDRADGIEFCRADLMMWGFIS